MGQYFPPPGGGDTSGLLPIADPTGVTIETVDNPVTGEGTISVVTVPEQTVGLAIMQAGDDFPRLYLLSDGTIYIGDGTADPYVGDGAYAGMSLTVDDGGILRLFADKHVEMTRNLVFTSATDALFAAGGPVVTDDTDGHTYRLGSSSGVISLTEVT